MQTATVKVLRLTPAQYYQWRNGHAEMVREELRNAYPRQLVSIRAPFGAPLGHLSPPEMSVLDEDGNEIIRVVDTDEQSFLDESESEDKPMLRKLETGEAVREPTALEVQMYDEQRTASGDDIPSILINDEHYYIG